MTDANAAAARRLSEAIRCKTVTPDALGGADFDEFDKLRRLLEAAYPRVHAKLKRETVDGYSLLYHWKGRSSGGGIALMAHQDVVPASESGWKYPPFDGRIEEGYVWGRGAIDMKCQLICILEAVEALLLEGFRPENDVYLVFGHNEESVRDTGAQSIAGLLEERGVRLSLVLDEGSHYSEYGDNSAAFLAVCEKGYADIKLSCVAPGGHASVPGRQTALGRVCKAVAALERHPMPARLREPVAGMLKAADWLLPQPYRAFAKAGLFPGLCARILAKTDRGAALVRTTMAATMASGSELPNVLPDVAEAVLNCRIAPWDTLDGLLAHMRSVIRDPRVNIEAIKSTPPTPVSDINCPAFKRVAKEARKLYPDAAVAPYIMLAATDSRFFHAICPCVIRFSPFKSMAKDSKTMHAPNERVSLESLAEAVGFFRGIIVGNG